MYGTRCAFAAVLLLAAGGVNAENLMPWEVDQGAAPAKPAESAPDPGKPAPPARSTPATTSEARSELPWEAAREAPPAREPVSQPPRSEDESEDPDAWAQEFLDSLPDWQRVLVERAFEEDADAMYELARHFATGDKGEKDAETAVYWYGAAAELGHARAQYRLAGCYWRGEGCEKDPKLALQWLRRAADQGHSDAMKDMGYCFEHGHGVEVNPVAAVDWYRKSAGKQNKYGMFLLAQCYEKGFGLPPDKTQALAWYRKAAGAGHENAARQAERLVREIQQEQQAKDEQTDRKIEGFFDFVEEVIKAVEAE